MDRDRFRSTRREVAANDLVHSMPSAKPARTLPITPVKPKTAPVRPSAPIPAAPAPTAPVPPPVVTVPPPAVTVPAVPAAPPIELPSEPIQKAPIEEMPELLTPEELDTIDSLEKEQISPQFQPPVANPKSRLSKRAIIATALAVTLLAGGVGFHLLNASKPASGAQTGLSDISGTLSVSQGKAGQTASVAGTIPFTPVVPQDKPNLAKLGSSAYNAQYNSYTFNDSYMNQSIRVSEQPLPAGKTTADLIDKIAVSLKAESTEPIALASGQNGYLLNNTDQTGRQVVVFSAKNMLVFVQSANAHDAVSWLSYLNSF